VCSSDLALIDVGQDPGGSYRSYTSTAAPSRLRRGGAGARLSARRCGHGAGETALPCWCMIGSCRPDPARHR